MMETILSIGIDDTDSPGGMCTTYIGFLLAGLLRARGAEFAGYPRLVRFNPNIPWKTRGNGAIGLKVRTSEPDTIRRIVLDTVRKNSEIGRGANPGVAFWEGENIPEPARDLGRLALWRLVRRKDAEGIAARNNIEFHKFGNGQGLVGAVGAIGYEFGDSTLELLSYRRPARFGTPRNISARSVERMQERTHPYTFNSYDAGMRRVLVAPRGPDPVLYGIRGDDPRSLLAASRMVRAGEIPAGYMMFQSNQGTADHLYNTLDAGSLAPYMSGVIIGDVCGRPAVEAGGDVFFTVRTSRGNVRCAVYKESGMTRQISRLDAGDVIRAGGGVRKATRGRPRVLNIEFVDIIRLAGKTRAENPYCEMCKKRMKSRGTNKGFGCIRCGRQASSKTYRMVPRGISPGLYLPAPSAQRHLARPYQRQGRLNRVEFDGSIQWLGIND